LLSCSRYSTRNPAEVAFVADEDPVEAFAADRADDELGVGVRDGRADRREDHADPFAGELGVAIADQEPEPDPDPVEQAADREVACLLGDPGAGRARGDACEVYAAVLVLDEEQDVEAPQHDRVDAEESQASTPGSWAARNARHEGWLALP
jgi:hypothetical protein